MKRFFLLILVILSATLLFTACKNDKPPRYYTVHFDSNGSATYQSRAIAEGKLLSEPEEPIRVGYTFLGWFASGEKWDFETDKVSSNMTLRAEWERVVHSVSFDSNGGSKVSGQTVASGDFITEPAAPTRKDHKFLGWFYEGKPWDFANDRVRDLVTLVAEWEPYPTYTVRFNTNGGTPVDTQYIVEGYLLNTPKLTTKAGSKFVGWYYDGILWDFEKDKVSKDVTLIAMWELIPTYTVTFDSNGGEDVSSQYVSQGSTATEVHPEVPTGRKGVFLGWYNGNVKWNFDTIITQDVTLTARWLWIVTVTFEVQYPGEETSVKTSVDVEENTVISITKIPTLNAPEGYAFKGWFTAGDVRFDLDTSATSNMTLKTKWEKIYYSVKFDSAGGTAIGDQTVAHGELATEPTSPTRKNYNFLGWFYKGELWDFANGKVLDNVTLTAKWEKYPTYTVRFDSNGGLPISEQFIILGSTATDVQPEVPTGSKGEFLGWYHGNEKWNFDTPITQSITLTARWRWFVTVTLEVQYPGELTSEITSFDIEKGTQITADLIPTAREGFRFKRWRAVDNSEFDFASIVNADISLKADVIAVYTVTFTPTIESEDEDLLKLLEAWKPIIVEDGQLIPVPTIPDGVKNAEIRSYTVNGTEWDFENDRVYSDIEMVLHVWVGTDPVPVGPNPPQNITTPIDPF